MPVGTRVAGAGAAGFAGNVLVGGVVGMAVDAATGATLEHYPNPVMLTLGAVAQGRDATRAQAGAAASTAACAPRRHHRRADQEKPAAAAARVNRKRKEPGRAAGLFVTSGAPAVQSSYSAEMSWPV